MKYGRLILWLASALFILCGCSSREVVSFHEINSEAFPYEAPLTAVADAGDSLLLGTARGDIVSFNLSNGSFRRIHHDSQGRFVYNIYKCADGSLIYSVQNGGVNHVSTDGSVEVYEINPVKGSNYSAYRIICDDDHIYAATSNGVYYWTTPQAYGRRLDSMIQSDPNDIISSRFYSIQHDAENHLVCSGESGSFSFDLSENVECLDETALYSSHDGMSLTKDGRIIKGGRQLAELEIPALDFVSDGLHVYAMSLSAIEILDASSGSHLMTISLPDERGIEKNVSCRSFCLIKGDYLYIAPGGCALYRMPLYRHWTNSEEVVQMCAADDGTAYILTCENDLYRFDPADMEVEYRRSFDDSEDVKLIGASGDVLLVTYDGVYTELSGRRLTDESELSELNAWKKGKVLWHQMKDGILYQGQVDKIRMYDRASGWGLLREVEKDAKMNADTTISEYYPQRASFSNNTLIVNTMHYGTFSFESERFDTVPGMQNLVMKDLEGDDAAIYALTDEMVVLNAWPKASVRIMFTNDSHKHFNDILPLNSKSFLAFSTYNRWCRGVNLFAEEPGKPEGDWVVRSYCTAHTVNDAVRSGSYAVAGGTMGLAVVSSDGSVTVMPVPEPTFFQKNILAWNYPWGIVIYVAVLAVALSIVIWCVVVGRRYYLRYRRNRIATGFYKWVKTEFEGKYIRSLAKQLIEISPDRKRLSSNIAMFKGMIPELKKWDAFIDDVAALYEKVKSQKAMDIEHDNRDEIYALKERLEVFCRADHPFGNSVIKAWGKTTVQPVRTLMLLPLKFKIKFMQVFDSRTGTEKMDFKTFMDKNKSSIYDRNLEIRDLIALSAYEALKSEKASGDA